jgi:predicted secreted acid phosphatase
MDNQKEVKQNHRIRITYSQLSGEEKKVYWENFKTMAKQTPRDDQEAIKFDQG